MSKKSSKKKVNQYIGGGNPEDSENLILCTAQNILIEKNQNNIKKTTITKETIDKATTIFNLSPDIFVLIAKKIVDKRSDLKDFVDAIKFPDETRAQIAAITGQVTGPIFEGSFDHFIKLIQNSIKVFQEMIKDYQTPGWFQFAVKGEAAYPYFVFDNDNVHYKDVGVFLAIGEGRLSLTDTPQNRKFWADDVSDKIKKELCELLAYPKAENIKDVSFSFDGNFVLNLCTVFTSNIIKLYTENSSYKPSIFHELLLYYVKKSQKKPNATSNANTNANSNDTSTENVRELEVFEIKNEVDTLILNLHLDMTNKIYKNLPKFHPKKQLEIVRRISTAYEKFINNYNATNAKLNYENKIKAIQLEIQTDLDSKKSGGQNKTKVTLKELRLKAAQLNIIGRSKMNKAELELALKKQNKKPKSKSRRVP